MQCRWGEDVEVGHYAGHPGLVYPQRPHTFDELFDGSQRWADRTFLVQGDRRISFGEFFAAVDAAREKLRALGTEPGQRIVLLGYNSPDWVVALWAIWALGAVPVLGNRWWSPREAEHSIALVAPVAVITDDTTVPTTAPVLDVAEFASCFGDFTDAPPALPGPADEDDPAAILFTSGSSGMPKGVELSFRGIVANQQNVLVRSRQLPHQLNTEAPQQVNLVCTPLFHVGALATLLSQMITGGRIVLNSGRFEPGQVLRLIEAEGVQRWGGVPTMAVRLLEHPDFDSYDLTSLRAFPLGGAAVSPVLLDRMARKLPQLQARGLANTWGMTEGAGFFTVAGSSDLATYPASVGRPYPTVELAIGDPDDRGVGEVLVRSPTLMLGYVGIDGGPIDSDGWLHTGDLGHLNDEGYLFIDGRSKDMVIRGGENISCPHVEEALLSHPDVVEAAVIGLPHPDLGEELAAVVVHRQGGRAPSEHELAEHLRGVVAYFAVPTRWVIREQPLPTVAGEKVDKKTLAAEFSHR
ncbi:acyl--CoA ligase [Mycobacterium sp. NBC_00419]|uniref:class I adenylate-forming enzyme family protein n=1 Tax=Mycobacterium sp. NBC_00419 TaxID=2975989 RepID=UPI002E1BD247